MSPDAQSLVCKLTVIYCQQNSSGEKPELAEGRHYGQWVSGVCVGHASVLPEQLWPPLGPGSSEAEPGSWQLVEVRGLAKELGLSSPWLICSRPVRAIISASLSQVEEQAWDEEGRTDEDMMGGGSSSFRVPTA